MELAPKCTDVEVAHQQESIRPSIARESPDGISGNLLTNCPFSTFGLRHCSRAASSELDIACESKPRNYSRDIAGARFSGKH